jgi:dTMP kinase
MEGKLIAIEGGDGCGKSTHARLLASWLQSQGKPTVLTDEPTDGPIGRIIKHSVRKGPELPVGVEALLFAADRLQHVEEIIEPALKAGKMIVTERYIYSSFAYQSARGLPLEWIEEINKWAPKCDLAIFVDVSPEMELTRINRSRRPDLFDKNLELQRRVYERYRYFVKEKGLKSVNGARPIKKVQEDIRKLVKSLL